MSRQLSSDPSAVSSVSAMSHSTIDEVTNALHAAEAASSKIMRHYSIDQDSEFESRDVAKKSQWWISVQARKLVGRCFLAVDHSLMWKLRQAKEDQSALWFLKICGVVFFDEHDHPLIQLITVVWFLFLRAILLADMSVYIVQIKIFSVLSIRKNITFLLYLTLLFQRAATLFTFYEVNKRLYAKFQSVELPFFREMVPYCWKFMCFSLISLIIFFILYFASSNYVADGIYSILVLIVFSDMATAGALAANLLFVISDTRISVKMVDELSEKAQKNELTISQFHIVRTEVDRRVNDMKFTQIVLGVVAVLNVITLVALIYLVSEFHDAELFVTSFMMLLLKELVFLFVLFWESAKVNEKADELTKSLEASTWNDESMGLHDFNRVKVFSASSYKPISYPIMFYRHKRLDVILQMLGVAVSSLIGIIKSSLTP